MSRQLRSRVQLGFVFFSSFFGACGKSSIVDHGDGSYSFVTLDGRDSSTTEQSGALTWSYIGQARHSFDIAPMESMEYVVQAPRIRSHKDKLHSMTRHDADGSVWRVTSVDLPTIEKQLAREDMESPEAIRGLTTESEVLQPLAVETIGERHSIIPFSWTIGSCGNAYYDDDDDRVQVSGTSSTRRKAIVEIRAVQPAVNCPYGGDYLECLLDGQTVDWCKTHVLNCNSSPSFSYSQCTGTILRSQWVLTAAHCIFDYNDNEIPASRLKVRRWDGVTSAELGVVSVFMDEDFGGDDLFDPKNDWALLKLASPLASPFSDMDISNASDSTLQGLGNAVVNLAFPAYAPLCSDNRGGDNYVDAMWMNTAGELGSIYSEKVNIKMDSGPGHSGSPIFYCPDGADNNCTGTELGFIVALTTGWDGFITSVVGPKAPAFRSTAFSIMANN